MVEKVDLYSLEYENVQNAKNLLEGLTHENVKRASKPLGAFFRWAKEVCQMYDDVRSNTLFYNVDKIHSRPMKKRDTLDGVQITVTDFN